MAPSKFSGHKMQNVATLPLLCEMQRRLDGMQRELEVAGAQVAATDQLIEAAFRLTQPSPIQVDAFFTSLAISPVHREAAYRATLSRIRLTAAEKVRTVQKLLTLPPKMQAAAHRMVEDETVAANVSRPLVLLLRGPIPLILRLRKPPCA
jgi:hypothetical protein